MKNRYYVINHDTIGFIQKRNNGWYLKVRTDRDWLRVNTGKYSLRQIIELYTYGKYAAPQNDLVDLLGGISWDTSLVRE